MEEKEVTVEQPKIDKKKEFWRTVKYTVIAMSAGLIEFGTFSLFTLLPGYTKEQWYWLAAAASLTLSVIWNFTFNRKLTFQSATNVPIAMLKVLGYYAVFGPLSIWLAQMYLIDTLRWNEFLVKGGVMFINFVTEFLFMRIFVFGKSIDTKPVNFKKKKKEESPEE